MTDTAQKRKYAINEDDDDEEDEPLVVDDPQGKSKPNQKAIAKRVGKQAKTLQKTQRATERQHGLHREDEKMIPLTGVPVSHFKAMLKKDFIMWKRNYWRSAAEILIPMIIFVVLAVIQHSIPSSLEHYGHNMGKYSALIYPFPQNASLNLQRDDSKEGRDSVVQSLFTQQQEYSDFMYANNMSFTYDAVEKNVLLNWLSDNCMATDLNRARTKWALVGDLEGSSLMRNFSQDVQNMIYVRNHSAVYKKEIEDYLKLMGNHFLVKQNLTRALKDMVLEQQPLAFRSERELSDYLAHPQYELDDAHPGICWALVIEDNLDTFNKTGDAPNLNVRFHTEVRSGRTPTMHRRPGDVKAMQQILPSTNHRTDETLQVAPVLTAAELYIRQGFSYIQNWVSNHALRVMTGTEEAEIMGTMTGMRFGSTERNEFYVAFAGVFPYVQIMMFLLPVYMQILRLQEEKQIGVQRHFHILGLSYGAQMVAFFVSFMLQATLITCGVLLVCKIGGMFERTLSKNPSMLFWYFWVQALQSFGFVIMISTLLPQKMQPKIAAKWGTLIFFGQMFADYMTKRPKCPTSYKFIQGLVFPNTATAKAGATIAAFNYRAGGQGLTLETLWVYFDNFTVGHYFIIMIYGFFLQLFIGMLFWYYGSLPEIIESIKVATSKGQFPKTELEVLKNLEQKEDDIESEQLFDEEANLTIRELTKTFYDPQNPEASAANSDYFAAVKGLNLALRHGQIFSFLGHNGAGKSTTISMLTGMNEATSGTVAYQGHSVVDRQVDFQSGKLENKAKDENRRNFRRLMGVCPQHDILFEELSAVEHLQIFCDFKGVKAADRDEAVDKIIRDVGLYPHRHTLSRNLSGGNKRKLSVALALVAGSQIVFLDEPTSGMDLSARRRLWNMLNEYKRDRIIILTTHNMDEAEILGDNIGIMKDGLLQCFGSPSFIKGHLSSKYFLGIKLKSVQQCQQQRKAIQEFLDKYPSIEASLVDHTETDLQFELQACDDSFFSELDGKKQELGIDSYRIKTASLEDLFLEYGKKIKEDKTVSESSDSNLKSSKVEDASKPKKIGGKSTESSKRRCCCPQTRSLLKRDLMVQWRNKMSTILEILIPVILVTTGLFFQQVQFENEMPIKTVSSKTLPHRQRIMINHAPFVNPENDIFMRLRRNKFGKPIDDEDFADDQDTSSYDDWKNYQLSVDSIIENLPGYADGTYSIEKIDLVKSRAARIQSDTNYREWLRETYPNTDKWSQYSRTTNVNSSEQMSYQFNLIADFLDETKLPEWPLPADMISENIEAGHEDDLFPIRRGSYLVYEANNKTKKFKVTMFTNLTDTDAMAFYPQFMYTALIRAASGRPDFNFDLTVVPFPDNPRSIEFDEDQGGIFLCFVAGIGLAMIPATLVSKIVHEKEYSLKHIQRVSGLSLSGYWLPAFISDYIKTAIGCYFILVMFFAFDVKFGGFLVPVLLFFPGAIIPFSYVTSFIFNKEITSQTYSIYMNFLFSGVAGMIVFVLRMIKHTALWGDKIQKVFRFICPSFNVCDAIIYIYTFRVQRQRRDQIRNELRNSGLKFLMPAPVDIRYPYSTDNIGGNIGALFWQSILCWLIFYLIEVKKWRGPKFLQKKLPEKKKVEELNLSQDVLAEDKRAKETKNSAMVSVNDFRKIYTVPFHEPVVGTEHVSFSVDKTECFALLGVNGAGKSTTFKSLTNVIDPTSGEVRILGKDISQDFTAIRKSIGYCPQHHALFHSVTVKEHLEFFAELKNIKKEDRPAVITELISHLNLTSYANIQAQNLSGGNKRKLQVAIALLGSPQVILLDEPSSGMDPGARRFMWKIVGGLTGDEKDTCVILTTHLMEEAEVLSSKMGIMVEGGFFSCFGTCQHIKDLFGNGYEIEMKLGALEADEQVIKRYGKPGEMNILQELVKKARDLKEVNDAKALENYIKQNTFFDEDEDSYSEIETGKFVEYLQAFKTGNELISYLLSEWQCKEVQVKETYGHNYFKVAIAKVQNGQEVSLGKLFQGLQKLKASTSLPREISEFAVQETSLDAIFQHFAAKQPSSDAEEPPANLMVASRTDCSVQ